MTVFTENGYFENGVFTKGLHPSMIGKKIIHVGRCLAPYGYDGSYCTEAGIGGEQNPLYEYVILRGINIDGSLIVEWEPRRYPGETDTLPSFWNDGKWQALEDVVGKR